MLSVDFHDLQIPADRQRKTFTPESIIKLADSISSVGLAHPVVVRDVGGAYFLVAGERRIRAMQHLWFFGRSVRCGDQVFPESQIPCIARGDLDDLTAFELELEENIQREDLPWQDRARATRRLFDLRSTQAAARGEVEPSVADIASSVRGDSGGSVQTTREELVVSRHLDDPDVGKAKSAREAYSILKRKEDLRRSEELGVAVGKTFTPGVHQLFHGDCRDVLRRDVPEGSIDVILTDPPYGIDADQFGDSGGRTPGSHFYDDSFDNWSRLLRLCSADWFYVAKPEAHLYCFCDVDNFVHLKSYVSAAGWKPFRTPLVWVNPTAMRTPWPEMGPQRKYQLCLFAVKGSRPVTRIYPDVVTYPSDENLNHHAQKPVALYQDLLRRSTRPGDVCLDSFCGTGTIFPACHELKLKAVGVEMDSAAYGIAVQRLKELK